MTVQRQQCRKARIAFGVALAFLGLCTPGAIAADTVADNIVVSIDRTTGGVGVVHNNILAVTAFAHGKADLGWKLMKLSAKAPLGERMLGAFDETMPGGGDLIQLWSFGPYLEAIIGGLAGINPMASDHSVEIYPHLPKDLAYFKLRGIAFGGHTLDVDWKRDGAKNVFVIAHPKGPANLRVLFRTAAREKHQMHLNGKPIPSEQEEIRGVMTGKVEVSLPPGDRATVECPFKE